MQAFGLSLPVVRERGRATDDANTSVWHEFQSGVPCPVTNSAIFKFNGLTRIRALERGLNCRRKLRLDLPCALGSTHARYTSGSVAAAFSRADWPTWV